MTRYRPMKTIQGWGDEWIGYISYIDRWNDRIVSCRFNQVKITLLCFVLQLYIGGTWYYAEYSTFSIDSESNKYTLRVSGFSGNAGDSLRDTALWGTVNLNGMGFTTNDADNDRWSSGNCAQDHGGGWWFNYCQYACFTCRYNDIFRWQSLSHLSTEGLRAARMMIQTKWAKTEESEESETTCICFVSDINKFLFQIIIL